MPIVVRHDPDYLSAYAQLAAQQSSSRQQQNYEPTPDTDVNPYTMSTQKGASIAAKLAADRERLGQKQKKEYGEAAFKDTAAGFDWLTPISIDGHTDEQGRKLNTTIYRNDGKDPLATGAWGALGTAEHHINDPGMAIDPANPQARAQVEALSRSGISGVVSEDPFLYEGDLRAKKDKIALNKKRGEMELSDEFAEEREDRGFARSLAQDEVRAGIQDQRDQKRQTQKSGEDLERAKGAAGGFFGTDFSDPSVTKMMGPEVAAALQKKKNQYGEVLANKDGILSPEQQAETLKRLVKDGEDMMRLAQRQISWQDEVDPITGKPTGRQRSETGQVRSIAPTYDQKRSDSNEDYATRQRQSYENSVRLAEAKEEIKQRFKPQGVSDSQAQWAVGQAQRMLADEGLPMTPENISQKAQEALTTVGALKGSNGAANVGALTKQTEGQTVDRPARVTTPAEVQSLPPGSFYVSPTTGKVYRKN